MVSTRFARLMEPAMAAPIRLCIQVALHVVHARALETARRILEASGYGCPDLQTEALEALGGRVPLLLEVKRGHNNRRLCALTLAALRTYGGPYCVESFDPTIVAWFRRNAPDILRGQLSQPPKDYGKALNKPAAAIVGNVLTNVIARPQFIAYKIGPKPLSVRLCEAMGAARAGWTSRAWTHERDYDIVIFEHYRPGAWFRADI